MSHLDLRLRPIGSRQELPSGVVCVWMRAIHAKEVGWPGAEGKGCSSQEKGLGRQVLWEVTVGTDILLLLTLTEGQQDDEYC